MAYGIIPIKLDSISSPISNNQPLGFFIAHLTKHSKNPMVKTNQAVDGSDRVAFHPQHFADPGLDPTGAGCLRQRHGARQRRWLCCLSPGSFGIMASTG